MPPTPLRGAFVMERRPEMDAPRAAPALPAPVAAALALGTALALGAGGAAAQNLCAGDVVTGRTTIAVCDRSASETRDVHINLRNPAISLTGYNESPVTADTYGVGSVTIEVTGGSLSSSGNWAKGIRSWSNGGSGDVAVTVKDVDITTANDNGNAVYVRRQAGTGNIRIDVSGGVLTTTGGGVSQGVTGWLQVAGDIDIDTKDVVMRTEGANSLGIFGYQQGPTGDVDVAVHGGSIETNGFLAHGVYSGKIGGTGNADLSVSGASVTTRGRFTRAVNGVSSGEGDVTVDVSGEAVIVAEGEGSVGVYLLHAGNGSGHATIGAETRTAAPFGNGVYGRLMPSANAAGRIVIDARGRIEARDTGILAWAEPRSGSTFGEGNEAADETAGTAPMIHVTSSGDVTVGEGVMDDYIDDAAAGDDGTLSAGERAVLDAITAGDEVALTTALDALPDDYDDAWKARMRAFRAARGAERTDHHGSQGNAPGDNARLAEAAAVKILDVPRAGIRAMALSHTEIADYVRRGGLGGTLSDDERTVLAAVLTGGDVEAALAALPADYTDTWKDGVRLRAMSYNAGDVQVDVTGGTITSEGDGVHARYALAHDRNGAITVTVADGAEINGGRHGVFVVGAGLAAGDEDLRAQTVTVNGAVMGGTGAGVHLAGGGTVTVGKTGRVGATSGDGILSDGAGDLTLAVLAGGVVTGAIGNEAGDLSVTVAGRVESDDLRAPTGGALRLDVQEGGVVTGTVHDPAGPLTVAGSIGRLFYTNGGTVTVAATGRLTGVEGESEAIRSESGNLNVTVAGTVAGDLRPPTGGALRVDVREGGAVTGTVHDPAGPLTVAGSIGRLLYTSGGTVTVAATGRLTGVEVEGGREAIRSESGDLAVTVARAGTVTGDVRGLGDGDLTAVVTGTLRGDLVEEGAGDLSATVSGTVEGDLLARGGGALTVDVQEGGAVTGTVHDPVGDPFTVAGSIGRVLYGNGGAVTVAATGRLTGVEVAGRREAVRSESGDLAVTVARAGTVTGDVRGLGDGDLRAVVAGTVRGDLVEEGAGDLNATVTGKVEGDLLAQGGGALTVDVQEGGAVTGTVHDPVGDPFTVAGSIGRVLYGNGGAVTVAATGQLTGVEVEGGREAVRSESGDLAVTVARAGTVTGDVRGLGDGDLRAVVAGTVRGDLVEEGAGDLNATVTGKVEGDLLARGGGALTVDVQEGGAVTGTVHDPASPLTVAGSIGRVLFSNGGVVTVATTGQLTGVEAAGRREAVRSESGDLAVTVARAGTVIGDVRGLGDGDLRAVVAGTVRGDLVEEGAGDLSATISGTVEGNVFGRGTGEHTVTVSRGGTVTGAIHLAASTVTVDGAAGRVQFDNGGMVRVTGRVTGLEGVAVRNAAGALRVTVAAGGRVEGDVVDLGSRPAQVAMEAGSAVTGTIDVAGKGSAVAVGGTAGRVRLDDGGTVTVEANGRVTGIEGEAITSARGDLVVELRQRAGETFTQAFGRISGEMRDAGGAPEMRYVPVDGSPIELGEPGSRRSVPEGANDVGIVAVGGVVGLEPVHARRSRVYEALPSVLLGLNGPADFQARTSAPRADHGGWARVEAARGKWKAEASASRKLSGVGLEYDHRRSGLQAGMDVAAGEEGLLGVSLHHRQGTADVSHGGEIELSGRGVGVSGAWARDDVYVDVQAEATWYEADFRSSLRGVLKQDAPGRGYALGVEAGRRFALAGAPVGMALTPRAGLVHSRVSVGGFTDAVGARVSLEEGRSLRGRAGMAVELEPGGGSSGNRLFGSLDVERELSKDRKVRVSGTELESEADATWVRVGLNGSHSGGEGRYALRGGVSWATSGGSRELGGGMSFSLRF